MHPELFVGGVISAAAAGQRKDGTPSRRLQPKFASWREHDTRRQTRQTVGPRRNRTVCPVTVLTRSSLKRPANEPAVIVGWGRPAKRPVVSLWGPGQFCF
jgi:hypothetical protein